MNLTCELVMPGQVQIFLSSVQKQLGVIVSTCDVFSEML